MRIVYFGSGDFSLPIIDRLRTPIELAGLVTVKPKPKGRGLKTSLPKIAIWAQDNQVDVFDPASPNDPDFIKLMSDLKPDLFVLSAYSHILGHDLLVVPRLGAINIHPSLLPKYRGAAPIQRAIMADEKTTGLTIFFMDERLDHGEVIFQKETFITDEDNYDSLSRRLSSLAAESIIDVITSIERGSYTRHPQDETGKSAAPKINKEETIIDWGKSARSIFNLIRALSPGPGARTMFRGRELIIIEAALSTECYDPRTFHIRNRSLYAGAHNGSLVINRLKPENRTVMSGSDFINGFRVKEGEEIQ